MAAFLDKMNYSITAVKHTMAKATDVRVTIHNVLLGLSKPANIEKICFSVGKNTQREGQRLRYSIRYTETQERHRYHGHNTC